MRIELAVCIITPLLFEENERKIGQGEWMNKMANLYYGWVITAIVVITMMLVYGTRHSFGVFFPYVLGEFHWHRSSTALIFSLNILIYGFWAPVAGAIGNRWSRGKVVTLGIVVLFFSTAGCAFAREPWHFYLLFGILMPLGTGLAGTPLLVPVLANWFIVRRGLVFGLGQLGGGLSFVYGIFANFVISLLGWRSAYVVLAGTMVIVLLPLYFLLFYPVPEKKGLAPYGSAEKPLEADAWARNSASGDTDRGPDWLYPMKTFRLWLLVFSMFLFWGLGTYLVVTHQVTFMIDQGYSSMFASSVYGLFGVFMAAGQISGFISDRIGRQRAIVLASVLAITALLAIIFVKGTSSSWLLYAHSICLGLGSGLFSATIFAGAADLFPGKAFSVVAGLVLTGMGIGGAIGPWIGGKVHDLTGSYIWAFTLSLVCFGAGCVAFCVAASKKSV